MHVAPVSPVTPGVEEAMGTENSGVLYALWSYPAQLADELSFKEADMVTILQRPEGSDWWWASLCGREGFVPNNYFGVRRQFCFLQTCQFEHSIFSTRSFVYIIIFQRKKNIHSSTHYWSWSQHVMKSNNYYKQQLNTQSIKTFKNNN